MTKTRSFLLAAGIALAMAFTFSCSGDDGEPGGGNTPGGGGGGKGNDIGNYKTVVIDTQTWMAENLNYAVKGSKCFGEGGQVIIDWDEDDNPITKTLSPSEVQANCEKYGRLYDWQTAQTVCPSGWHLPSNDDWDKLFKYVDAQNGGGGERTPYKSYTAGKHLKAADGWAWFENEGISGNGTDKYEFSALPGGFGYSVGSFGNAGILGVWWSASEASSYNAYYRIMDYSYDGVSWYDEGKSRLFSVRCLQD